MDVTAGILGIQAEIAENKASNLRVWVFECRDPSYQAFKLGLIAALLLSLAHMVSIMLSGCVCIWSKQELDQSTNNKQLAAASHVLSWIIMAVAFFMLISGALSNTRSRQNCGISHNRLLSIGGVLCFLHGLFAVAYYITATATIQEENKLKPATPAAPTSAV
ncbi:OLC1v1021871C2 [Oldenlandia corymbosa var. corymbosa]|nr:OLC1v1021871C2 [Oldenlandia corymbosa var. corymbosa]